MRRGTTLKASHKIHGRYNHRRNNQHIICPLVAGRYTDAGEGILGELL